MGNRECNNNIKKIDKGAHFLIHIYGAYAKTFALTAQEMSYVQSFKTTVFHSSRTTKKATRQPNIMTQLLGGNL